MRRDRLCAAIIGCAAQLPRFVVESSRYPVTPALPIPFPPHARFPIAGENIAYLWESTATETAFALPGGPTLGTKKDLSTGGHLLICCLVVGYMRVMRACNIATVWHRYRAPYHHAMSPSHMLHTMSNPAPATTYRHCTICAGMLTGKLVGRLSGYSKPYAVQLTAKILKEDGTAAGSPYLQSFLASFTGAPLSASLKSTYMGDFTVDLDNLQGKAHNLVTACVAVHAR
jgi:hypothetical protein